MSTTQTAASQRRVDAAVDLTVDPLDRLQTRRSDKWAGHRPGVIAATIAEMDFPIAARSSRCYGPRSLVTTSATPRVPPRDWPKHLQGSPRGGCTGGSIPDR
jgi:hypothetical protein